MRTNLPLLCFCATLFAVAGCERTDETSRELELVKEWVHGNYNNVAQADADIAADLPPEEMHRPMHQLFVPGRSGMARDVLIDSLGALCGIGIYYLVNRIFKKNKNGKDLIS